MSTKLKTNSDCLNIQAKKQSERSERAKTCKVEKKFKVTGEKEPF